MPRLTTGRAVAAALRAHGAGPVLGIPGTHNLGLYAGLAAEGLRCVTPRHEQGGGYAADAFARVGGRPGVLVTTTGPGILNAATALAQAWSDSSPVLAIAPGLPTTHRPGAATGFLHESRDQFGAVASVVDVARRVSSAREAADAVRDAFTAFGAGRPRPWYLEIPLDLVDAEGEVPDDALVPVPGRPAPPDGRDVEAAARLVAGASRPGIVAGGGSRGAAAGVRALAERLGAGVVTTSNGRGVLPEGHPLSLGAGLHLASVQQWLRGCDVVIAVGTELAESDAWTAQPIVAGRLVRIDVDPAQADVNGRADVLVVADAADALGMLLEALGPGASDPRDPADAGRVATARSSRAGEAAAAAAPWAGLLAGLAAALPEGAVLAADNATACYGGALVGLPVAEPSSYLFPTGLGTLGFAVPAAVGAALAAPHRAVAALTGDGGLAFTAPELATLGEVCATAGRGVPVVVVDNGGYGEIRDQQRARGDAPLGVDLAPTAWVSLAQAYGAAAVQVAAPSDAPECAAEVAVAVQDAWGRDVPTVIAVREGRRTAGEGER